MTKRVGTSTRARRIVVVALACALLLATPGCPPGCRLPGRGSGPSTPGIGPLARGAGEGQAGESQVMARGRAGSAGRSANHRGESHSTPSCERSTFAKEGDYFEWSSTSYRRIASTHSVCPRVRSPSSQGCWSSSAATTNWRRSSGTGRACCTAHHASERLAARIPRIARRCERREAGWQVSMSRADDH